MNAQSPIVSEFETTEQAEAYDQWLRGKVASSLNDGEPVVAHDMALARAKAIVEKARSNEARLAR
jgi:hypothetical protein